MVYPSLIQFIAVTLLCTDNFQAKPFIRKLFSNFESVTEIEGEEGYFKRYGHEPRKANDFNTLLGRFKISLNPNLSPYRGQKYVKNRGTKPYCVVHTDRNEEVCFQMEKLRYEINTFMLSTKVIQCEKFSCPYKATMTVNPFQHDIFSDESTFHRYTGLHTAFTETPFIYEDYIGTDERALVWFQPVFLFIKGNITYINTSDGTTKSEKVSFSAPFVKDGKVIGFYGVEHKNFWKGEKIYKITNY